MSILNKYFNARINPFTGEQEPKHIVAGDEVSDYPFIPAPSSYNAPEDAPVRIEIELPEIPDLSDLVNRPLKIYKTAILPANLLTRVAGEPTTDNTYRIGLSGTERSHCLQLSANLISTPIYFDYYGLGTVLNKSNLESLIIDSLKVSQDTECQDMVLKSATVNGMVYIGADKKLLSDTVTKNEVSAGLSNISNLRSNVNECEMLKAISPGQTVTLITTPNPVVYTDYGCRVMVLIGIPYQESGAPIQGRIVVIDKGFTSPTLSGDLEFTIDDDPVLKVCSIYMKNNAATYRNYRIFKPNGYPVY